MEAFESSNCKIAGKTKANARIYLNVSLIRELCWLWHHIEVTPPIRIFSPTFWDPINAKTTGLLQLEVFTDASSLAMAYYFPSLKLAYHASLPPNPPASTIF